MKTRLTLDYNEELDFSVIAINSHVKSYKLCWELNKLFQLNFEKLEDYNTEGGLWFSRYRSSKEDGVVYDIVVNRSKKGYLIPALKSVNYFLVIDNYYDQDSVTGFMNDLRKLSNILLVFKVEEEKYLEKFMFNDKKD